MDNNKYCNVSIAIYFFALKCVIFVFL